MTTYIIKFKDQTHLSKPEPKLLGNFLSDEKYSPFDRTLAIRFECEVEARHVADIVHGNVVTLETSERFELGKTYLTIKGEEALVTEEYDKLKGYETIAVRLPSGKDGGRYNRSTGGWCNGRTTGSKWTEDCLRYPPEEVVK